MAPLVSHTASVAASAIPATWVATTRQRDRAVPGAADARTRPTTASRAAAGGGSDSSPAAAASVSS
jgi:hypothetical protein